MRQVVILKNLLGSCEVKLPGAEFATVDIAKLREYCLNPSHPRGRHKSRVFAAALNLTQSDAEFLRDELLRAAREVDATEGVTDQYGLRYILDFELARNDRIATVRSTWIIRRGEGLPRLTSCFVLLK
jgi:hypothetical protein